MKLPHGDEALPGHRDCDRADARVAAWEDAEATRDPIADPCLEHRRDHTGSAAAASDRTEHHFGRLAGVMRIECNRPAGRVSQLGHEQAPSRQKDLRYTPA